MSRASDATSTRALQYARTIATLAGEQIRIRIASSASIWLSAGTARRTAPPPGAVSGSGRLPSHAERLTSQGAARGACRSSTRRRSRTRTACAGASATNSSTSAASPSVRPPSGAKRASPIVAPATHADHRPARSSETSNLKLAGTGWSALNAGTRWRAARRGRHTGSSTTASSPSRRGAGAASTSRRHAGGTTSARALDGAATGAGGSVSIHHLLDWSGPATAYGTSPASPYPLSTPGPARRQARKRLHRAPPRSRGSSTSRSASPSMLKPKTASEIATPGHTAIHGARNMYVRPEPESIAPHDGKGGGTPKPRNESADSARVTAP